MYDFIYIKCPEQANPKGQKADQWLEGGWGGEMGSDAN